MFMNVFVHPELRTPTSDRSVVADGVNGAVYVFLLSSSLRNHKFPVVSQVEETISYSGLHKIKLI